VGLQIADNQHEKFLEIIRELGGFLKQNENPEKGSAFFFSLIHFAENYILKEKMLVNSVETLDYSYFREKHTDFLDELNRYQKAFRQGNKAEVLESLYAFLKMVYPQFIKYYTPSLVEMLKNQGVN
jgi:hemerythrin-like metal-binding protein